jgi:hypothetical protein
MKTIKSLFVAIFVFAALMTGVFADPISETDLNVVNDNGDYVVLVSLGNANIASGIVDELNVEIEELGTSKNLGFFKVETNESQVELFNLKDLTDNYDLLKKGETYTVTISTSTNSMTESFLFGTEKDTEGLDLIIEEVEVDGLELNDNDELQVINGESIEIQLRFSALGNFDDARLRAEIVGYEHGDIYSSTDVFAVVEGKTYVKTLTLNLPADMDSQESYKLRLSGANDLSGLTYKDYVLYVDTQRDRVDVLDLVLTPSSGVEPGQNIIANVRLKNRGQQSQDSVKVSIAVPGLNIVESSYVSNLNFDEVVTSDDMLLFVPEEAVAGQYEVVVSLTYDDGYTASTESFALNILAPRLIAEDNLIVSFNNNVDLVAGDAKTFDVVIANPNSESKPISITALENAWADVQVSPSLAMVAGGSDAQFKVTVTPKSAVEGEKSLTLTVKEGTNAVSELTVNTYVEGKAQVNYVNIALAVLLVIAIIILLSLVVTIARRKNEGSDEETSSTEEYY